MTGKAERQKCKRNYLVTSAADQIAQERQKRMMLSKDIDDDNQIYDPNLKEKEDNHLLKDILPNGMQPLLLNFGLSENL